MKHRLALFDLDGTLVDWRAAFTAWAEEFVAEHQLGGEALAFLLAAGARHTGPRDSFFVTVCQTFNLAEPPGHRWAQYRRRMPELVPDLSELVVRHPPAGPGRHSDSPPSGAETKPATAGG